MSEKIGYQDGITAFFGWYRKQPGVPGRGPGYNPDDISTWPWPDKIERTLRMLKDAHDAAVTPPTPGPDPEPEPEPEPERKYPPRTHNAVVTPGAWKVNARFCTQGLQQASGVFFGPFGDRYDNAGRCLNGARNEGRMVPGLKSADSMDGREPCQGYTRHGRTYGPGAANWPAESYLR